MQSKKFLAAYAAVFVLAIAIYLPGLGGSFVFDDLTNILQVPGIRINDLSLSSILDALGARDFDIYIGRPMAMLSFALNYYFAGFDAFYFKLTNLAIHIATGAALFWLTLILLRQHQRADKRCLYRKHHLPWVALAITSVWLLHPLNLIPVLYVVQRMTSLATLFVTLGLIGYCHGRQQIIRGKTAGFATIFASLTLFGSLAILNKENGTLLLPLAAVIEIVFYRFAAHARLSPLFRRFWLIVIVAPLVIAAVIVLVQHERWFGETAYRQRDFTLEDRLMTQARALWFYLRLIVVPDISQMSLHHDDFAISQGLTYPFTTLVSLIGIGALLTIAFVSRIRYPIVFFAIAWFLVGHSMESSVLPLEPVYEHRNYLPEYGVFFAIVFFAAAPYHQRALKRTIHLRIGFLILFGLLLAAGTYSRSLQWKDILTLYTRETANHPQSPRSHTMLGALLHANGMYDEARQHFTIATDLTPDRAEHLLRLIQNVYQSTDQVPGELLEELRRRIAHGHVSSSTLWVFERLLLVSRKDTEPHTQLLEVYEMLVSRPDVNFGDPWYEAAYRTLAENHAYQGRVDVALAYYDKARKLNPRAQYDISAARLYAENGCYDIALDVITKLRTNEKKLDVNDEFQLGKVEALLVDRTAHIADCAKLRSRKQ